MATPRRKLCAKFSRCHKKHCEQVETQDSVFTWSPEVWDGATRHSFYEEFKPLWIILKLLGMLPYHVNKQGDVILSVLSKEMLYSLVVYTLLSVPVLLIMAMRYREILHMASFDSLVFSITMYSLMVPHLVMPFSHWQQMGTIAAIFKAWRDFEEKFREVTYSKFQFPSQWKLRIALPHFLAYILLLFGVIVVCLKCGDFVWEILCYIYVITFFDVHHLAFICQSYVVIWIARDLKTRIKQAVQEDDQVYISNLSSLWLHLSKISRSIGVLFYRMNSHFLLSLIAISTMDAYTILKGLSRAEFSMFLWHAVISLKLNKIWMYLVCESGERVYREVGLDFMFDVADMKFGSKNPTTRMKLDELTDLAAKFPPVVSLNGYITINRSLLMKIWSTMATYIIVVWQFSQTTPVDSTSGNATFVYEYVMNMSNVFF